MTSYTPEQHAEHRAHVAAALRAKAVATHWMTRYHPDDGEPYGTLCDCEIGVDHDATGTPNGLDQFSEDES